MREDFALIPVIDLKDGGVVHARAGKRYTGRSKRLSGWPTIRWP
jgi:uncharacterized protein related to proFAR isomerase